MTFDPNIPQTTDPILLSYYQLRANFQAINTAFSENHVGLTQDPKVAGKHNLLLFQVSSDPTTSANQVAIYTKIVSGSPELFYRPSSNQTAIQLTYSSILTDGSDAQYSYMAGPFIVYMGKLTGVTNNQLVILSPGSSLIYVDLVGLTASPTGIAPTNLSGMSFNVRFSITATPTRDLLYYALGLP